MIPAPLLLLADALPEALLFLTPNGRLIGANRKAVCLLGTAPDVVDGRALTDLVDNPPDQLARLMRTWARSPSPVPAPITWNETASAYRGWRCQGFLLRPAAAAEPAILALRCLPGRTPASEFLALNRELVRQQAALRKLEASRRELENEHEKAIVTLQSIGDAVITTDRAGRVETMNPVAVALTGWSAEAALGQPLAEVFRIVNEITRQPAADPVARCLKEGCIVGLANHTALLSRDGTEYVIEDSAAPIRNRHGDILGAVLVYRDVTGDRLARRQLEYLAQHDTLTGLNNRYYFEQQLKTAVQVARRGQMYYVLLYIDLDQFKMVNDTAGHGAGDELLTEVARLFAGRTRQADTLARLGGDEFGVLLIDVGPDEAVRIAEDFVAALSGFQFSWEGRHYDITPSVGITMIDQHTTAPAEALRRADIACYVAKRDGRNRAHMYDPEDEQQLAMLGELSLVRDLREALATDRFTLHFQPIVHTASGGHVMHEALVRMVGVDGELITPGTFIPVAERYGLMPLVDRWVVATALKHISACAENRPTLSVNLSGASLGDTDLLQLLTSYLGRDASLGKSLVLEITETAAVSHIERAGEFMRELKRLGCQFALDDFGTGFSSFAYLKHLPVDYVKIDGTFVRDIVTDPVDQAMVRSINHIAHSLGKETIAEFVENDEILRHLREFGVDYVQGYHIGRPAERM